MSSFHLFEHSDAWIMTSGINQDMIRLIGTALQSDTLENDIPCIGFCSWKYISGIFATYTSVSYYFWSM
jgi:hypothetical protein